jgi:hypothetical protein
MKKRIALGLALALAASVGTTAFAAAANPFTDVPARHWSYNAIQQLSKAGIVEGYNDGQFKGDRTITRYEMAVIVAKAMAREDRADASQRAIIDKLAAEFSAELDNLGVRVTNLENKVGNIKFSADARIRYDNTDTVHGFKDRFRLNMNADLNDNTSVYARYVFTDQTAFNLTPATTTGTSGANANNGSNASNASMNRVADLAFTTRNLLGGSTAVTVGRYTLNLGPTTFLAGTTGGMEGVESNTKLGNVSLQMGYANASYYLGTESTSGRPTYSAVTGAATAGTGTQIKNVGYAELKFNFSPLVVLNADYFTNQAQNGQPKLYNIYGGGLSYGFGPDWKVVGEYYENSAEGAKAINNGSSPKATIARLAYKGANKAIPGSWGAFAEYTKFEVNSLPDELEGPYTKMNNYSQGGLKSYDVNVNYTLAKNVVFEGIYQFHMKDIQSGQDALGGDSFTRLQLNYFF